MSPKEGADNFTDHSGTGPSGWGTKVPRPGLLQHWLWRTRWVCGHGCGLGETFQVEVELGTAAWIGGLRVGS